LRGVVQCGVGFDRFDARQSRKLGAERALQDDLALTCDELREVIGDVIAWGDNDENDAARRKFTQAFDLADLPARKRSLEGAPDDLGRVRVARVAEKMNHGVTPSAGCVTR